MEKDVFYKLDFLHIFHCIFTISHTQKMVRTKQTAKKSNKGLPKATKGEQGGKGRKGGGISSGRSGGGNSGVSSGGSGGGSDGGGGALDGSDGNRNTKGKVPSGRFSQQLEN